MTLWHRIFCSLLFFWITVHLLVLVVHTRTEMKKERKSQTPRSWKGQWQIVWPSHLQLQLLSEFTRSRNNHEYPAKSMSLTMLWSAGHTQERPSAYPGDSSAFRENASGEHPTAHWSLKSELHETGFWGGSTSRNITECCISTSASCKRAYSLHPTHVS